MMLKTTPAVFAVENEYQIMAPVSAPSLFSVRVGDKVFCDACAGVLRSAVPLHRVCVPMRLLDRAKKYTVCITPMRERAPYYPQTGATEEFEFSFRPVRGGSIRVYHMADTHNRLDAPVAAAKAFGKTDLLILNGDIAECSATTENFDLIYKIIGQVTGGEVPVVFSRGNHDLRGECAERLTEFIPNPGGRTYYTFRLGKIWGIVLDCGEDKDDGNPEYGGTVCCHAFREEETAWLERVVQRGEYAAKGIRYRMIVVHTPFTYVQAAPFDIELPIFSRWARLLKKIKPDIMLCGHLHQCFVTESGGPYDMLGQPCPMIVGAELDGDCHAGCGLLLRENQIAAAFYDSNGKKFGKTVLKLSGK